VHENFYELNERGEICELDEYVKNVNDVLGITSDRSEIRNRKDATT
jgi:hypothetical protein